MNPEDVVGPTLSLDLGGFICLCGAAAWADIKCNLSEEILYGSD